VESYRDDASAEVVGQAVVVVPAVAGLVGVAVGSDPGERREEELAVGGEADADGDGAGVGMLEDAAYGFDDGSRDEASEGPMVPSINGTPVSP